MSEVRNQMLEQNMPQLREGRMVPLFTLPSAGGVSGPGALRSKYNMVLAFVGMGAGAEGYLRSLTRIYPAILDEQARVIAVVVGERQEVQHLSTELALPFTALSDNDGRLT